MICDPEPRRDNSTLIACSEGAALCLFYGGVSMLRGGGE
jgi:hypothetical protein